MTNQLFWIRHKRRVLSLFPILFATTAAVLLVGLLTNHAYADIVRPFTPRFTTNDSAAVALIGNASGSCPTSDSRCLNAQQGISGPFNNNSYPMAHVDVDGDPATFNSSSASLNLPASTSDVLWAGLYWGGDVNNGTTNLEDVLLQAPGATSYQSLVATVLDTTPSAVAGRTRYQGFVDVTEQVRAAGNGFYTVANVQATAGNQDSYAGWAIVIAYRDDAVPLRNVTIFDGFAFVANNDPDVVIPVSGFLTPLTGPVTTTVGLVAYEGDWALLGDQLQVNDVPFGNDLNPLDNFFNSTNTTFNSPDDDRIPNIVNQMGVDIDSVALGDLLGNGATSATIRLTTNNDAYYPGVVTFRTNVYAPEIDAPKTVVDVNGGLVLPGDILEYTIQVGNSGFDTAENVILRDPIPADTTYVSDSLAITAGANAGSKTDLADGDQAEFDAANNQVVFRLGTGADGVSGGTLLTDETTAITFRVVVDAATPPNTVIANQGVVDYASATLGTAFETPTNEVQVIVAPSPDVSIAKTDGRTTADPGDLLIYTLDYRNDGNVPATNVVISETVPLSTTFSAANSNPNWNCVAPDPNSLCTLAVGTLAVGEMGSTAFAVTIDSSLAITSTIENTAVIADDGASGPDPTPANNIATDETAVSAPTAVELVRFVIEEINGRSVTLLWETASEIDNFGFQLYRHTSNNFAAAEMIHFEPSTIGTGPGTLYRHSDTVPEDGRYWYWLADVDTSGTTTLHDPVVARVSRFQWQFLPLVRRQ